MLIEEAMLEDYFLLVRRIPGISLSPSDFWELDTFTTQKLVSLELEIMEKEEEAMNKSKSDYVERPDGNAEEMNSLMDEMSEDND